MNTKRPNVREDIPEAIPYSESTAVLAREIRLKGHVIPNRICYQPMEGCDGTREGAPDELTVRRYLRFAKGGAGLIWFEATAIVPEGRANPRQMHLTEATLDSFARLINDIKETEMRECGYEPVIVCQLTHSGRWSKPEGVPHPIIAYKKPIFEKNGALPDECVATDEYLDTLPELYGRSTALAARAGFDGVDIKACHGYLLSELLNAYLREGKYGGSFENRTRLFFDSVEAARAAAPGNLIIGSRFNAYDGYAYPYGMGDSGTAGVPDLKEAKMIAQGLRDRGASLLNVTMGCPYTNHEVNRPTILAKEEPPYLSIERMLLGARAVKETAPECAVVSSGLSFLASHAANVAAGGIEEGFFDLAGFGRLNFSYPELAGDIIRVGKMKTDKLCLTCGKCTELMRSGRTPGCVIYDKEVYGALYSEMKLAAKG